MMSDTMRMLKTSVNADQKPDPELDLEDPETNYMAMLKIRGDLSGKDFVFAFPGEGWAMVPGEGNYKLFKTFGIGCGRYEETDEGYRIINRELLYTMDPDSGEIISEWSNPFLGGRKVEVFHVANDPVNGVFKREGAGMLSPPYPYIAYGDNIVFQWDFYIYRPAHILPDEYPLYSAGKMDQHAELWGIQGRKSDVLNPEITSGECTLSWSRISQWLPWMEMGNQPGTMAFQSHCVKLMDGVEGLPRYILDHTEKHYPKYLEAPKEWSPQFISAAGEYKKVLDKRSGKTPAEH
jgi:hypothetical protein